MSTLHAIDERNRANAQHSTGPKTEEGKQKSSQNARKHGLASGGQLFIPAGDQAEFDSLYLALFHEVRPVGELQMQFFEQLVHASWNQQIARRLLADALAHFDERKIALANRYLGQYERSFAKALKELKALQTDLALRVLEQNEPISALPLSCEIKTIAAEVTKITRSTERTQSTHDRWAALSRIGAAFEATILPCEASMPETDTIPDAA